MSKKIYLRAAKLLAIILLTLFTMYRGYGQNSNFSLTWGKEFSAPSWGSSFVDLPLRDESGCYVVFNTSKSQVTLGHLDRDLNSLKFADIAVTEHGEKCSVKKIISVGGKLCVLYSLRSKTTQSISLFIDEVDKTNLQPRNKGRLLKELKETNDLDAQESNFSSSLSPDGSKILVTCPAVQKDSAMVWMGLLDGDLKTVWESAVSTNDETRWFFTKTIRVDNAGNVYWLGDSFRQQPVDKNKVQPVYQKSDLYRLTENGSSLKLFSVEPYYKELAIHNDTLYGLGFDRWKQLNVHSLKMGLASDELITKKTELKGLETDKPVHVRIIFDQHGNTVLLGEEAYTIYHPGSRRSPGHTSYYFKNIFVVMINATNNVISADKIEKGQSGNMIGQWYLSYGHAVMGDKIYFLFNDNADFVFASLDGGGNQTRQTVVKKGGRNMKMVATKSLQVSSHEVIVYGEKGKRRQFGKLELK